MVSGRGRIETGRSAEGAGREAFRSPEELLNASVHKSGVSFAQITLNKYVK